MNDTTKMRMIKNRIFAWMRGKQRLHIPAALHILRKDSYLTEQGWFDSFNKSVPVDKHGEAIPWYSYSATGFLEGRINGDMSVFEYGSGNSTIWWAKRVSHVVSCEHDDGWFKIMKPKLPQNVEYIRADLAPAGNYSRTILQYDRQFDKKFDIVIIDGRERVSCAVNSLPALSNAGVLIWDDTYREQYRDGYGFLVGQGFRRLDFAGFGPINPYGMCTSVFYRDGNCLGI